jgi:hypothetical protein
VRLLWGRVRGALSELTVRVPALTLAALIAASAVASAATPKPAPHGEQSPVPIDLRKVTPKRLFPKVQLHTEFVVEVNKRGQVTRIRSGNGSADPTFNAQTYGNALQAFIRTPDGNAISGVYRLTYDYDPKTSNIHRDVALMWPGGVDANAEGAAVRMMKLAGKPRPSVRAVKLAATPAPAAPRPAASVNAQRMPDLPQVMQSPPH